MEIKKITISQRNLDYLEELAQKGNSFYFDCSYFGCEYLLGITYLELKLQLTGNPLSFKFFSIDNTNWILEKIDLR